MAFKASAAVLCSTLAIGVASADAATLVSAAFHRPTLTTRWMLDSGDCASALSVSNRAKVDSYGFFTGWHARWGSRNCLATSNAKTLRDRAGAYYLAGRRLRPATYYVQLSYCHDSDFSIRQGNYYCRGSNVLRVRIPRPPN